MTLQIGDILPPAIIPDRALCIPGASRWHALIVAPQCEAEVVATLSAAEVYAFYPITTRVSQRRGKRITHVSRYLPGYVFAEFPGDPLWHRILRTPATATRKVIDLIRRANGWPAPLRPDDLAGLHAMRDREAEAAAIAERAAAIMPGDSVFLPMFGDGPCEVIRITAGVATVTIRILGSEREIEADVASLTKA